MKTLCESRGYVLYLASDEEICRGKAEDREDIYIDTQDAFRKLLKAGGKYGDTITAGNVLCMDRYGMSAGAGCGVFLNKDALDEETINTCISIFEAVARAATDRIICIDDEDMEKPFNSIFNAACDKNHLLYFAIFEWLVISNKTASALKNSRRASRTQTATA